MLADVFEAYCDVWMKNYQLDAAHYISAPQLSLDAMLKLTDVELELISDPEMFKMIDTGVLLICYYVVYFILSSLEKFHP